MLTGICVGTNDLERAGDFYDNLLSVIGFERTVTDESEVGYSLPGSDLVFWVLKPFDGKPATFGNGTQVMFSAPNRETVHRFHETALRLGGSDEGAPGPRDYSPGYYGAYCRDRDGNKLHVYYKPG